ncbi:MAG: DNA polymerase/3'-5' exonuclease PolX [Actinomycetes bacterium]
MSRSNAQVVALLEELVTLTVLDEQDPQSFRVRAYEKAVRALQGLSRDVSEMSVRELTALDGVGRSTAEKVREVVETGTMAKLEELRARHPAGQRDLLRIPGLGPKTIALLQSELGVTDLEGLRAALEAGKLAGLPGLGEKTQQNVREALERSGVTAGGEERRTPIAVALPAARALADALAGLDEVERVEVAGSLRRFRETIGDVDLLVASTDPAPVMAAFRALPEVSDVLVSGDTKTSIVTWEGLQVDLRVVPPDRFGAALVYFTGSKAHNIQLRQRALQRDLTLNEYALARLVDGEPGEVVAAVTEQDVYAALDLAWVPPERREDTGEVEAAARGGEPGLVTLEALRGDLHDHTDLSGDGRQTLEDLVAACVERGLDYLAITDHAEDLTINGASRAAMLEQRTRIRRLEDERGDIALLHGAELNIGIDGSVDYDPEFLAGFDFGVASVHSHFRRPVAEQTRRILTAMRDPAVNVVGHLTGRRIGTRPGIDLDVEAVVDAAVETGCAIEVNGSLARLDAPQEVLRLAVERGATLVISTDAHALGDLDNHEHGVRWARRAGVPADLVANTWPRERFLDWVRAKRAG